jgi:hypothetical protein
MPPWFWVIIVFVVLYILATYRKAEDFASNNEKAAAIWNWFKYNSDSRGHLRDSNAYGSYKAALGKNANVVEYERIVQMAKNSDVNYDTILRTVNTM